jgi:hypothetical protein
MKPMPGRLRLASVATVALAAIFYLSFDLCKHNLVLSSASPFVEDPYDAVA